MDSKAALQFHIVFSYLNLGEIPVRPCLECPCFISFFFTFSSVVNETLWKEYNGKEKDKQHTASSISSLCLINSEADIRTSVVWTY